MISTAQMQMTCITDCWQKEHSKGVNEMYRTMDEVEKECYEEGREKGRETQAELTAINLRKLGLPLEQIAHAVGFHVEKVEKWVK